MRILVISDTHGQTDRAYRVFKKLIKDGPLDLIVHCGDYIQDGKKIEALTGIPSVCVKGNCDGCFEEDFLTFETEAGNFMVTHGHIENVDFSQQNLYYKALEANCIGVLYGHTHRGVYTQAGSVYIMNPGSLTKPRDGSGGTFGLLITSKDNVWGKIYNYNDFIETEGSGSSGSSGSKKVHGGHLRDLLNYSDRF